MVNFYEISIPRNISILGKLPKKLLWVVILNNHPPTTVAKLQVGSLAYIFIILSYYVDVSDHHYMENDKNVSFF